MLKKTFRKYIIILTVILLGVFCLRDNAYSEQANDELEVKPLYFFTNKGGKDPFSPRHIGQSLPAFVKIDITSLALVGVTESEGTKAALFVNKTGQSVGFVFLNGRLFGDNDEEVIGISGEIKSENEVLLVQGDKEVLYTLNEPVNSLNIRPTDTISAK